MSAESSGVFTLKEINRIKIIQDVIERRITTRRAAEHLGISDRQCRRLLARYREGGPLGMASRRCGMRGNRQLPPGLRYKKDRPNAGLVYPLRMSFAASLSNLSKSRSIVQARRPWMNTPPAPTDQKALQL